jgi:hypothetical protein
MTDPNVSSPEVAQRECLKTIDQWRELVTRWETAVKEHESYAPDAFAKSLDELRPAIIRRLNGLMAWGQILCQMKGQGDEEGLLP